jgi:hypothetical protein
MSIARDPLLKLNFALSYSTSSYYMSVMCHVYYSNTTAVVLRGCGRVPARANSCRRIGGAGSSRPEQPPAALLKPREPPPPLPAMRRVCGARGTAQARV